MAQALGILKIWWQGQQYACQQGSSLKLPGMKNTTIVAGYSAHRAQSFSPAEIKATPLLLKGMTMAEFTPGSEGELQVQADTGQTWTFPDAYILDAPSVSDGGGKMPVTWNASTSTETTSNG